jgi:hypothetical protein
MGTNVAYRKHAFISYSHLEWENFAHMELTRVAEGHSLHVMCMPILSIRS